MVNFFVALLDLELPIALHEAFIFGLLLFVFFHGEDVIEEPFENLSVAVNADVDLIVVANLFKAPVEVLHVFDEERAGEREIALLFLTVVDHVYHDAVFEVRSLEQLEPILLNRQRGNRSGAARGTRRHCHLALICSGLLGT